MTKRFEALEENECYVLAYASYLGNKMIIGILNDLGIDKLDEAIRSLCDKKLITCSDFIIEVQNFRLLQKCIKEFLADDVKELITKNILEKLNTKTIDVIKFQGLITESQMIIYKLSKYAISHGDYNAYLRNCKRFLSIVDNLPKKSLLPELKDAKQDIYAQLSKYLNKYPSHKIYAISKIIFDDCMRKKDDLKIMNTSSLMLDSALMGENYILAQQSLHQVLIRLLNPALTEGNENVQSKYFFYSCINVKILFHAGRFSQCVEAVDKILISINQELFAQLAASNVSKDAFLSYLMTILLYGALARVFICDSSLRSYLEKIKHMFSQDVPAKIDIINLEKILHKQDVEIDHTTIEYDMTSQMISAIVNTFLSFDNDYNQFAQGIYQAKLIARAQKESFWSLLCDLLIGYSYQKLDSTIKAQVIFTDVATTAQKSGMSFILALANWFIANLKYELHEYDNAYKIIGDNIVTISRYGADDIIITILSYILQVNIIIAQNSFDTDLEPILYKINYACEKCNLKYLMDMLVPYEDYLEKYKQTLNMKVDQENILNESTTTENQLDTENTDSTNISKIE